MNVVMSLRVNFQTCEKIFIEKYCITVLDKKYIVLVLDTMFAKLTSLELTMFINKKTD